MYYIATAKNENNFLMHHGIKGMKWGVRRYQNYDGTRTNAGKKRYGSKSEINKQSGLYEKLEAEGVYKPWFTQEELDRINGKHYDKSIISSGADRKTYSPEEAWEQEQEKLAALTRRIIDDVHSTPVSSIKNKKRRSLGEFVDDLLRGW